MKYASLVVLALFVLVGCSRPGEKQCKEACLRYSKLYLDDQWAERLAAADSVTARQELEKEKAAEWKDIEENPDRGLGACVASCDRMMRQSEVDCIMDATTFAEVKKCDRR